MPLFRAKPFVVEAYQFHGSAHDMPMEYVANLSQNYAGAEAHLPSSVVGQPSGEDGMPIYAAADIVNVGDWIVRGVTGFSRMGPGEFDAAFMSIDPPPLHVGEARWHATYVGADDGSTPSKLHWLGYQFLVGEPVAVADEAHAAQIAGNAHFRVVDTMAADEPDAEAAVADARKRGPYGPRKQRALVTVEE